MRLTYFFGKTLWECDRSVNSASLTMAKRWNTIAEGNLDSKPRLAVFVAGLPLYIYGHSYGHTGLVIEDSDGYTMNDRTKY